MRKVLKSVAAILIVAILFCASGCGLAVQSQTGEETNLTVSDLETDVSTDQSGETCAVIGGEFSLFSVVVNSAAPAIVKKAADYLTGEIERFTGCKLKIISDTIPAFGPEILVGQTNRPASSQFGALNKTEYVITTAEDSSVIVLTGGSSISTFIAVGLFLTRYTYMSDGKLLLSGSLPETGDYTDPKAFADVIPDKLLSYPRICAHRGCNDFAPENTIPAFALAVALGAEEIELDIRVSADGEFIILHNDTVNSTSNGSGSVSSLTLQKIKSLDAGSWYSSEFTGLRYNTFSEVLDLLGGKVIINIHVKSSGSDVISSTMLKELLNIIDEHNCREYVYIAGRTDVIAALADMGEDITKCLLAGTFKYSGDQVRYAVEHNIPKVQLANDDITKELLAYGKEQGIIFTYATIDSSTNALAALETGVDVILTNKLTVIKAGIH